MTEEHLNHLLKKIEDHFNTISSEELEENINKSLEDYEEFIKNFKE